MPLTQEVKTLIGDKFTDEQIAEMLLPEAQTAWEKAGNVVRTKDQDERFVNSQVETKIKTQISEVHKKYDEDFFEILGERKQPNEKTYEFAKRKLSELKEKAENSGNPVDKDKVTQLETKLREVETSKNAEIAKIKGEYFRKNIDASISAILDAASFAVPAHLTTDAEKQAYIATQKRLLKTDFLSRYTPKEDGEGKINWYEGETLKTSSKDGSALDANALVNESYSSYFAKKEVPKGGAGSGNQGGSTGGGFTTKKQVVDHLQEKGFVIGSKAATEEYEKLIKEYAITEMGE